MRLLLLRELKRQAPAAAGMFGLGLLFLTLSIGGSVVADQRLSPTLLEAMFVIVAVGAPWLLSVTAVAPDQETGAEDFLVTLPVPRGRLALLRAGVALGFSVLVIVATAAVCVAVSPLFALPGESVTSGLLELSGRGLLMGCLGFSAGTLATVLVGHTLGAFALAPALIAVPAFLYTWCSARLLHLPGDLSVFLPLVVLPVLFLIAAWRVYTRPSREQGWRRPTRIALKLIGALFLIGGGLTTTAFAVDHLMPQVYPGYGVLRAPDGSAATLVLTSSPRLRWRGPRSEAGSIRSLLVRAGDSEHPRELPAGLRPVAFSPDGRWLLTQKVAPSSPFGDLVLLDTTSLARQEQPAPEVTADFTEWQREAADLATDGASYLRVPGGVVQVLWQGGVPWLAHPRGVARWDGEARHEGQRLLAARGRRALLEREGAVVQVDLAAPRPTPLAAPAGVRPLDWVLGGPEGRYAVILGRRAGGRCGLWVADLEQGGGWRAIGYPLSEDAVFGVGSLRSGRLELEAPLVQLRFALEGRYALISTRIPRLDEVLREGPVMTVDLTTGRCREVCQPNHLKAYVRGWITGGRLLTSHGVWDPARGTLRWQDGLQQLYNEGLGHLLVFEGRDVVLRTRRFDLDSGEERPYLALLKRWSSW